MLEHRLPFNTSTVYPQWIHPTHCLVYVLGVKTIKPSDLKQVILLFEIISSYQPLLVIVRGVYKKLLKLQIIAYFLINLIHVCINYV